MKTAEAPLDWRARFTRDELATLIEMHDVRSWLSIVINWSITFGAMALVAHWPNPLTVILALALIGARQLGCAVLMHEASHRTLLSDKRWNDGVGNWLCAYPVWSDLRPYRPYHLQHHAKTGTADDPDIGLITPFPITKASLRRKIWRDLSGQTGVKFARAAYSRTFGRALVDRDARQAARGVTVTNLALLGLLWAVGHPALYLLWVGAWFTTNTLVTRVRSIAEHALTPQDELEPRGRTRTILASPLARLFVAPHRVNYHLEHHLVMTVPHYSLPKFHATLEARGLLDDACIDTSYVAILRRAAGKHSETRRNDATRAPARSRPF